MSSDFEERLIDYLSGDGPESFEEELFEAAADDAEAAAQLRGHWRLREGLRALDRVGLLDNFITRAQAERLRASTTQVVELYDYGRPGEKTSRRPTDAADVVIARFVLGDLRDVRSIDIESYVAGTWVKTLADVDFDPNDDSVYTCCSGGLARYVHDALAPYPASTRRFVGKDAAGAARVLGEFEFRYPSREE